VESIHGWVDYKQVQVEEDIVDSKALQLLYPGTESLQESSAPVLHRFLYLEREEMTDKMVLQYLFPAGYNT
jgi:hypothetical protein